MPPGTRFAAIELAINWGCKPMPVSNSQIAELLRRYASLLAVQGADRFKVKAYRRAAGTVEQLSTELAGMVLRGEDLKQLPGIGNALSHTIVQIVETGGFARLVESSSKLPPQLAELAARPRLDPRLALRAYKKLGIDNLKDLQKALDRGDVREQLGNRLEYCLRQSMGEQPQMLLWEADKLAPLVENILRSVPGVEQFSRAGDLRRRVETVSELAFLVAGATADSIFNELKKNSAVRSFDRRNQSEAAFRISSDRVVSITWCRAKDWGKMLVLKTGSQSHLADVRLHATKTWHRAPRTAIPTAITESGVYEKLGLRFIEPELREGRGEVAVAAKNRLPHLVALRDIRGDLHMHTTASDGANTLHEMADAATAKGYQYIAIADHSQSLKITNGLTEKRLFQQIKAIDRFNAGSKNIHVLKSAEVDILEDGRLDYSNSALKELDLTVCSIHSRFSLDRRKQTERIMRAMDNRYFTILGHATGRLLLKREGYELAIERLIQHAVDCGCYFEINANPDRLDLSDENAKLAKAAGVKIAINTDAHSTRELNFMSAGLNQARRGWLEAADVLNTLPLAKLLKLLKS